MSRKSIRVCACHFPNLSFFIASFIRSPCKAFLSHFQHKSVTFHRLSGIKIDRCEVNTSGPDPCVLLTIFISSFLQRDTSCFYSNLFIHGLSDLFICTYRFNHVRIYGLKFHGANVFCRKVVEM